MSRSLAYMHYTHDQVVAALTASSRVIGARFEVLDNHGAPAEPYALTGVTDATVEWDGDRAVPGSLSLRMAPDDSLVGKFLLRQIRPWFRLLMPDGGIAEWAMGVYPWTRPQRSLTALGQSDWTVVLGDLMHLLDIGGPGLNGYWAAPGQALRDHIVNVLTLAGIADSTGVPASITATLGSDVFYDLKWGSNSPGSWQAILAELHISAGLYRPFFDPVGVYQAVPVPDLRSAPGVVRYATSSASIIEDASTDTKLEDFANRVIGTLRAPGGSVDFYVADADDLVPNHPASHASLGVYADWPLDDRLAFSAQDLARNCQAELFQRLAFHESLTLNTWLNPAHTGFDVIEVEWTDDVAYSTATRFLERHWSADLLAGTMSHTLYGLVAA